MKKLLFILTAFLFSQSMNAQGTQTEDEVYIGKGKTFGNYRSTDTKPVSGQITGTVVSVKVGRADKLTRKGGFNLISLKKDDGTVINIGTSDNAFAVPRVLVGRTITIEGDVIAAIRRRREVEKQQDIQFAASGIIVID